jgi:hypothetical protein
MSDATELVLLTESPEYNVSKLDELVQTTEFKVLVWCTEKVPGFKEILADSLEYIPEAFVKGQLDKNAIADIVLLLIQKEHHNSQKE